MNHLTKRLAVVVSGAVFLLILTTPAPVTTDEWNLATVFSVNQPFEVPGKVLEPNTKYLIKLLDSPANRGIIQVFNDDRTHLIKTFFGISSIRPEATDKTTFEFMEVPAGNPLPIRAWYYPGRKTGLEFMYSKKQLQEIAGYTAKTSLVESAAAAPILPPVTTESVESTTITQQALNQEPAAPAKAEPEVERSKSTEPEIQQNNAVEPEVEQSKPVEPEQSATSSASTDTQPSELPKTADVLSLIGLAGALSLSLGVGVRGIRR